MEKQVRRIGVLTSGGDAPGMNAAVRAVVRTTIRQGIECIGIRRGWHGLISGDFVTLDSESVSHIIDKGGTILYTARSEEFRTAAGRDKALATCKLLGLDGIVAIGGDGTFRGALALSRQAADEGMDLQVAGIPATIDNDIGCSKYTIGFDTACNTAIECIDKLRDTMQSHERCSLVEVMGRHAGYLALYVGISVGATAVLIPERAVIVIAVDVSSYYGSFLTGLRHAFFQVSSILTTTGYATTDFNLWPTLSKGVLVVLMFIGGCAGSTAGGIKVSRVVIGLKSSLADMRKMLHPNAVTSVQFEEKPLTDRTIRGVQVYLSVYLVVFTVSFLLLCLEDFDLVTTFTALTTCINNVGPGLEVVGPMGNFSTFSDWGKILLSFDMLLGRLEIFPLLLLFAPSIWKRRVVRHSAE